MKMRVLGILSLLMVSPSFAADLKVTSKAVKPSSTIAAAQVFNGMGCTGTNVSPDLKWTGAPKGTKAFAVTVYDPDAPTGSGWWHWVAFNIPASVTSLPAGASPSKMPKGTIESRTDFGKPGYGGPCPPTGDKPHHYQFKVYALKDTIPLDANSPAAMVGFYINQSKIAEGGFEATYGR